MSDDEKKMVPAILVEPQEDSDGHQHVELHGPSCDRTIRAWEAQERGESIEAALRGAECKGPPKVSSAAFRRGYDAINWGGKPVTVGQA